LHFTDGGGHARRRCNGGKGDVMAKVRNLVPTLRAIDTRTVKPLPKTVDAELTTPEYRRWAQDVKARAGYQCEWVENGRRCQVRAPARLFADHIVERRDGGALLDLDNGQCLCGSHHTLKTTRARAARLAARP
jgi:hypothetical protein